MMLNQQTFQGNWDEVKVKLRGRWGSLTEDDLFNGNVDQLMDTIQRKTGEPRASIEQFFQQLASDGAAVFRGDSNTDVTKSRSIGAPGICRVESMVRRPTKALALYFAAGVMTGVVMLLLCGGDRAYAARRITRLLSAFRAL